MKRYRIVSEGFKYYVEAGTPINCYWRGDDCPIQWMRVDGFHTYQEAQQYISFVQRSIPTYSEPYGWFK